MSGPEPRFTLVRSRSTFGWPSLDVYEHQLAADVTNRLVYELSISRDVCEFIMGWYAIAKPGDTATDGKSTFFLMREPSREELTT